MESRTISPLLLHRSVCAALLAVVVLLAAHALAGARADQAGDENILGAIGEDGSADADGFPWSNAMLQWQRTGYHFQPKKNYMNDPSGPMYYRGWYHLFYQHNPRGAVKGDIIAWGHAVSRDLVRWRHLPLAMVPDHWYDIKGVMTGSTTVLPDGRVALLYTGNSNTSLQLQCLAVPANPRDPLLRKWKKHPANPVLLPPPGVGDKDFRDPTTAWFDDSDRTWRTVIGSKHDRDHAGIAMVYRTRDFLKYELVPGLLHRVKGSGMWECVDFYPVGGGGSSSNSSEEALYVMKESSDDDRNDYYALGRYNAAANRWTPLEPKADLGFGLRYDWGKFYASKTFYDPVKRRRVLWGWVSEADSKRTDVVKGWGSLQSIPRTVALDEKTRKNLLQWPVEEIDTLRLNSIDHSGITIHPGSVFPIHIRQAAQLDIEASFRLDASAVTALKRAKVGYNCSTSGGAAKRGVLGPFGLLVHANDDRSEQTALYFYVSKGHRGLRTNFCHDESRSSLARSVVKRVVGSIVPVLHGEALSVRVLVDHSIVESFPMGGRLAVTSRVYPTEAIYAAAGVYVFNNATGSSITIEKLVVHEMDSSSIRPRG